MTIPGELARVTGLSRPDAGRGNRALVAEGYATMPARGEYWLGRTPPRANTEASEGGRLSRARRATCHVPRATSAQTCDVRRALPG